jgi:hypothetical protein
MSVYCHGVTGLMAKFAVKKYHSQGGITANNLAEVKEEKKKDDTRYYAKGKVKAILCIFYFWKLFEGLSRV